MTEQVDFGGLTIAFDDRVLRPRPWTEAQSSWAAELLTTTPPGPVLELCAGAGQIGLLAAHRASRDLVMVDLDEHACGFARRNAAQLADRCAVEVRHGDMTEVLRPEERFAAVLADPPWVPRADTGRFPEDPLTAIDGGDDGLDLAWRCLTVAARHVAPEGWVLLQLGTTDQVTVLEKRLADAGGIAGVRTDHGRGLAGRAAALSVVETREHDGRGVVVLLRPPAR